MTQASSPIARNFFPPPFEETPQEYSCWQEIAACICELWHAFCQWMLGESEREVRLAQISPDRPIPFVLNSQIFGFLSLHDLAQVRQTCRANRDFSIQLWANKQTQVPKQQAPFPLRGFRTPLLVEAFALRNISFPSITTYDDRVHLLQGNARALMPRVFPNLTSFQGFRRYSEDPRFEFLNQFPRLRALNFGLAPSSSFTLEQLDVLEPLEEVSFHFCDFEEGSVIADSELLRLRNLRKFTFSRPLDLESQRLLESHPGVTEVEFDSIDHLDDAMLSATLSAPHLRKLTLRASRALDMTDMPALRLARGIATSKLTTLICNLTTNLPPHLDFYSTLNFSKNSISNLKIIDAFSTKETRVALLNDLAHSEVLTTLEIYFKSYLSMDLERVIDENEILRELGRCSKLETLTLHFFWQTDPKIWLEVVKNILNMASNLRTLSIIVDDFMMLHRHTPCVTDHQLPELFREFCALCPPPPFILP